MSAKRVYFMDQAEATSIGQRCVALLCRIIISSEIIVKDTGLSKQTKYLAAYIDKALAELPEKMQKILSAPVRAIEVCTHSTLPGTSAKAVEAHISRVLIKLRQRLAHCHVRFFFSNHGGGRCIGCCMLSKRTRVRRNIA